ncbi:MAG: MucR family transcriptional regulator [Actinomycetota bacterium]|nr:MucR family transcriptional regulator [Actinomycetota bacterium]
MIHPVGRLPPQVYWRRRLLLAGIVLAVAASAGWFFTGGASGDSGGSGDTAAADVTESAADDPPGDSALTGLEQVVPSLVPIDTADAGDPLAAGVPTEGAAPAEPAAAEPGPCPDAAIGLAVGAEFGQYVAGSKPRMALNVTNISPVACIRDLDPALQTWGLYAGDGTRLWGSNDCYPNSSVPTPLLLQPGQVVAFSIIWSGKTSEPTCTVPRLVLGPGSYILRGFLGNLVSPDAGIVLT